MDRGQAGYEGPLVVPEVRPFKQRELTFGLPHTYAILILWVSGMMIFYLDKWAAGLATFVVFYFLGRAGNHFDPYWAENIVRLPFIPRILAPGNSKDLS